MDKQDSTPIKLGAMKRYLFLAPLLLLAGCGGSGQNAAPKPYVIGTYQGKSVGGDGQAYGDCQVSITSGYGMVSVQTADDTLTATGSLYQGQWCSGSYTNQSGESGNADFRIVQVSSSKVTGSINFYRPNFITYLKFEASK